MKLIVTVAPATGLPARIEVPRRSACRDLLFEAVAVNEVHRCPCPHAARSDGRLAADRPAAGEDDERLGRPGDVALLRPRGADPDSLIVPTRSVDVRVGPGDGPKVAVPVHRSSRFAGRGHRCAAGHRVPGPLVEDGMRGDPDTVALDVDATAGLHVEPVGGLEDAGDLRRSSSRLPSAPARRMMS